MRYVSDKPRDLQTNTKRTPGCSLRDMRKGRIAMKTAKQQQEEMTLIMACMECLWIQDCSEEEEQETEFSKYRRAEHNKNLLSESELQELLAA